MGKINIKALGIEFKKTGSEKTFKELYEACKRGTINFYKSYSNNTTEMLEDCYNETFISIWNDINKLDVEKYSISTMVYLKMKQNIIRYYNSTGGQFTKCDIDDPIISNKVVNSESGDFIYNLEDDYIKDESVTSLWNNIREVLDNELSFNMLYDKYANHMKTNEIAEKHGTKPQNVLNRVFNAKKKIETNKEVYKELYNEFTR
jgi:RNA polymerase sigma factor (sigma-70 family)